MVSSNGRGSRVLLLFVITILAFAPLRGQPDKYLLGTWQLDLERSRYSPGPGPASETRLYVIVNGLLMGSIRRTYADGRDEVIHYGADFDREYPVKGARSYDAVRFKRIDARTAEAVLSHAGRVFGLARRVISEDGQTMTIVFRRDDGPDSVHNVAVYRRQ